MKLRWRLLLVIMTFVVGVHLSGCARNPVTGESEIAFMSRQEEISQGKKYYPIMTQLNDGELKGEDLQEYVSRIGHQLAKVSHRPDLPYAFNVVNSSTPNAYALPGGFISITRGLLLQMDDEDQLAAVIGHEIAHVTARHAVQQQVSTVFANIFLTIGSIYMQTQGVEYGGLYQDLGKLGARAILASYSRSQERQADRLGIEYMVKAGYDPQGMIELQQILLRMRENRPGVLQQMFSTHPLSENRIEYSRETIDQVLKQFERPVDNQLNLFHERVAKVWLPRRPAYNHMDTGVQKLKDDHAREALPLFDQAIKIYGREALFHTWKGWALEELGREGEARESLNRAVSLHGDVFRIRLYSGINRFHLEQFQKSLEDLERADELLQGYPAVIYYRGRNYEALDNRQKAAHFYKEYLKRVNKGEKAEYCYRRLREWGYV